MSEEPLTSNEKMQIAAFTLIIGLMMAAAIASASAGFYWLLWWAR